MLNWTARHQHSSAAASPVDPRMRSALAATSCDSSPTELMRERAPALTLEREGGTGKGRVKGTPSFPIWLFVVLFAVGIREYLVIQCFVYQK